MSIYVEIHITPTYIFEPDEAPESLDYEVISDFLAGIPLPDGYISATITDLDSGDFIIVFPED